jgi:EpsI family protein
VEVSQHENKDAGNANEPPPVRSSAFMPLRPHVLTPSRIYMFTISILLITFAASYGVELREKASIRQPFSEFPMSIGAWTGMRQTMPAKFVEAQYFSEYIMAGYRNPEGRKIDFYLAYYESQRKGESTHSPETCLPGSGWSFRQAGLSDVPFGDGKTMLVNLVFLEKDGSRQVMYFWFPQRGRILTSLFQVKLFLFWDALTLQRTDGALVRMITPVYPDEGPEDAEKRLHGFATEIVGVLGGFLPS